MSKLSNAITLLRLLQNGKKYSIKELAIKLEVSPRMIREYKNELELAGIFIESLRGPYGGYYLTQEVKLPEVTSKPVSVLLKDKELYNAIQIVNECYQRGGDFLPVSVKKSHATKFLPEDGKIRMPFISLPGLGDAAAQSIMKARDEGKIHCIEDLKTEAKVGNTLIELLRENGALEGMNPTNQMSLFDLFS